VIPSSTATTTTTTATTTNRVQMTACRYDRVRDTNVHPDTFFDGTSPGTDSAYLSWHRYRHLIPPIYRH
jgi:hypothetical protein